jgi:hypothetical protein
VLQLHRKLRTPPGQAQHRVPRGLQRWSTGDFFFRDSSANLTLQEYHPINVLRNIGLRNVDTPYVFLADIDFLPMRGLYSVLRSHLAAIRNMKAKVFR